MGMLEVEVKARIKDPGQLKAVMDLIQGWDEGPTLEQEDLYFSHPGRDLSETDEALRIRRVGDLYYLTYKGPKLDSVSKTRRELEARVDEGIKGILQSLGFSPVAKVRKTRRVFERGGTSLMIDDVEGLGKFVELESASGDRASVRDLLSILESLGLVSETRSYLELLLEAGRE
jgi:adenylate cyclase class 2